MNNPRGEMHAIWPLTSYDLDSILGRKVLALACVGDRARHLAFVTFDNQLGRQHGIEFDACSTREYPLHIHFFSENLRELRRQAVGDPERSEGLAHLNPRLLSKLMGFRRELSHARHVRHETRVLRFTEPSSPRF